MKIIKQSCELLKQENYSLEGIQKFIERCARVSYKSEDKITDTSYKKFVKLLQQKDHGRALEFGTVHFKVLNKHWKILKEDLIKENLYNPLWIKTNSPVEDIYTYVTTNYRLFSDEKFYCFTREYLIGEDGPFYPKRITVHMITSRGVMDEFRTHISLSHLAESTRWVNYSKDKFDNSLTFILPNWVRWDEGEIKGDDYNLEGDKYISEVDKNGTKRAFFTSLLCAEHKYMDLIKRGWTPQQAREVLPLSVKSELISCGFIDAWNNFFYRRCANDAHPMAKEMADNIVKLFNFNI